MPFDYTLTARPCCAVDNIENDEERKKMVQTIGALLDKADRVYRQLVSNKPVLEGRPGDENSNASAASFGGAQINRVIQSLAHKYCVDSKGHFEDLSKIIQKVLACRKELVAYDRSQSEQLKGDTLPCQDEVRSLICLVTRDNLPATDQLCNLLSQRITLSLMGHAASQDLNNSLWVWCCPALTDVAGLPPAASVLLRPEALAGLPGINTSSPNCECHQSSIA
ncbi:hypothetical protein MSG28_000183 [Choristoneura fumiferana]|uniref:Uncharacterized protein n=1 Tax=Choristoneura fumiferana TaxID=7141 RepID=A0ACC0JZH9_CHOFU|nr:hypothetical protein MSG28_000183 [Choristoneura fumiferana]